MSPRSELRGFEADETSNELDQFFRLTLIMASPRLRVRYNTFRDLTVLDLDGRHAPLNESNCSCVVMMRDFDLCFSLVFVCLVSACPCSVMSILCLLLTDALHFDAECEESEVIDFGSCQALVEPRVTYTKVRFSPQTHEN